jgi:hypothetical protein
MDSFDYDDISELESDIYSKNHRTPQQIMLDTYDNIYKRNWKEFLNSIEWDGLWLRHDTPEEKRIKQEALEEHRRQVELETHPFRQWF